MGINRVTSVNKRQNWTYDSKEKLWYSYQIDVRVNGERFRDRGFKTRDAANDAINELKTNGKSKRLGLTVKQKAVTVKELFQKRLDYLNERKQSELETRVLNYFTGIVGENKKVTEITVADLRGFVDKRSLEKTNRHTFVTGSTVNRELTIISSVLKSAWEYFPALESWNVPKIPRIKNADNRRTRIISGAEQIKIIDHFNRPRESYESASQYLDRLKIGQEFEFALLTSSRRKEVIKLKWSDYFAESDLLKITRWKTIKSKQDSVTLFTPLPIRVRELLELRRKIAVGEYVFSNDGKDAIGYLKSMKLACKKLKIPYGRFTDGGLTFHDSRHTFVSNLLENNVDLETTRELAGLSRDMILRYAHSSAESKKKAVSKIDKSGKNNELEVNEMIKNLFDEMQKKKLKFEDFKKRILMLWSKSVHGIF